MVPLGVHLDTQVALKKCPAIPDPFFNPGIRDLEKRPGFGIPGLESVIGI
jgi:hypothetical protein